MTNKFSGNRPDNPSYYYYKDKPLQHFYKNTYSKEEKLEITLQIERDFEASMITVEQLTWIIEVKSYGGFTAGRCLDKLLDKKVIKKNPITGDDRRFSNPSGKPKSIFDW
jgi:hypothetical protein